MQTFRCPQCGTQIFFENSSCLSCGCAVGYAPGENVMLPLQADNTAWQACGNRGNSVSCNWLVATAQQSAAPVNDSAPLCECCSYTRTIPPMNDTAHQQAWRSLEQAKRYLFYSLLALNLPIPNRVQQPDSGLAFEFLAQLTDQQKVLTGHADGIITINIAEADDAKREQRRISLHEPYRTLLGHLRHEIGHFYWQQLIANSSQLENFRHLFGDERQDYATALQQHYRSLDDGSWQSNYISRYASAHPWEDWAESWAHYLHITDALDTAQSWRVNIEVADLRVQPMAVIKNAADASFKDRLIKEWLPLSQYLNAACRSLGETDAYPFILSSAVIDKLVFIHAVIREA